MVTGVGGVVVPVVTVEGVADGASEVGVLVYVSL